MKLFSKKQPEDCLVASLGKKNCRLQLLKKRDNGQFEQMAAGEFSYRDLAHLELEFKGWCRENLKGVANCRWLLSRDLYQTFQIDTPNVAAKEIDQALAWQVKDLLDQPLEQYLISHYIPSIKDPQKDQLMAVTTDKGLVEAIINTSKNSHLSLDSIDIDELAIGHALIDYLSSDKVVGLIAQDHQGLIFNFYYQGGLAFSRFKKGLYVPGGKAGEFSLNPEAEEESFLLETQRTLDYVVSQIFRKPVDGLLLYSPTADQESLAMTLQELTELSVTQVASKIISTNETLPNPRLVEVGAAMRVES